MIRDSEQQVAGKVAEHLMARGDTNQLRSVLENLINNAWKFTGRSSLAHIDVGLTERDGRNTFVVRDNGVVFNMNYADKVFMSFQRLHGADGFPGTGIGLTTVQRIITRHGGQVWAKSVLSQGTRFNDTLEEEDYA